MSFDVHKTVLVRVQYDWQKWFETFSVCRNCEKPTIFLISQRHIQWRERKGAGTPELFEDSLNPHFTVERVISLVDSHRIQPPDHVPPVIAAVFDEAAACLSIQCWNATGAMLRLCIDLSTKALLPNEPRDGLNANTRGKLAPRLAWLIDNGVLPEELRELSTCIREDGNDAAHDGTLKKVDAEDLLDFTTALFERIYTEPERLKLAKARRDQRRKIGDEEGKPA